MAAKEYLTDDVLNNIVNVALAEDVSHGDITSEVTIPPDLYGRASMLAKAEGVLAGGDIARMVFLRVDPSLDIEVLITDGGRVQPGDVILQVNRREIEKMKDYQRAMLAANPREGVLFLINRKGGNIFVILQKG